MHTKNELFRSRLSEVRALQTDRQRHRQTDTTYGVLFSGGKNLMTFGRSDEIGCMLLLAKKSHTAFSCSKMNDLE